MRKPQFFASLLAFIVIAFIALPSIPQTAHANDALLQQAYENRQSDLWIQGEGKVKRLLKDDLKGSRHQRFILKLKSGQTLLISHNIDLAPRINGLKMGDIISFSGEYEWNKKGGVLHWTHHDPRGKRNGGWLRHQGKIYR